MPYISGISVERLGATQIAGVVGIPEAEDFCPGDFRCDFREMVFASNSPESYKKDFSDFLFRKIADTDTIALKLVKNGLVVAEITDNSYGPLYDGFPNQLNYIGLFLDWSAVYAAFGGGPYQLQASLNILGANSVFTSRYFDLYPWNERLSHNTVKIETFQEGNIIESEFDYTGLVEGGWKSSIRLPGELIISTPEIEIDRYLNSSYQQIQNYEKVIRKYNLNFYRLSESVLRTIIENKVLANKVLITDYNLFSDQKWQAVDVAPESFSELTITPYSKVTGSISFTNRADTLRKRNF